MSTRLKAHPAPATGATVWNVSNAVCKELFEGILLDFAKAAGAGANKRIVLQLDGAGWHGPENLTVPDGVRLVFSLRIAPSCNLRNTRHGMRADEHCQSAGVRRAAAIAACPSEIAPSPAGKREGLSTSIPFVASASTVASSNSLFWNTPPQSTMVLLPYF